MTSADVVSARLTPSPTNLPDTNPPWAVHATAVAIDGLALLIRGPSKIGKSRLALALIAAGTRRRPICLVGDDRVILAPCAGGLVARPHPRIAGFIERRGLGIVSMPFAPVARLGGILDLLPQAVSGQPADDTISMAGSNFPRLSIVISGKAGAQARRCRAVLTWFPRRDKGTTPARESVW